MTTADLLIEYLQRNCHVTEKNDEANPHYRQFLIHDMYRFPSGFLAFLYNHYKKAFAGVTIVDNCLTIQVAVEPKL